MEERPRFTARSTGEPIYSPDQPHQFERTWADGWLEVCRICDQLEEAFVHRDRRADVNLKDAARALHNEPHLLATIAEQDRTIASLEQTIGDMADDRQILVHTIADLTDEQARRNQSWTGRFRQAYRNAMSAHRAAELDVIDAAKKWHDSTTVTDDDTTDRLIAAIERLRVVE